MLVRRNHCKVIATSEGGKKTAAQEFHFNSEKSLNFWETKGVNIPQALQRQTPKGPLEKSLRVIFQACGH